MPEQSLQDLEAQISALEQKIANEPERILAEAERKRTTMPASDEALEQHRERMHQVEVSRKEVSNIRITQAKDGTLLLFFVLAIVSLSYWIYNAYQATLQ